MKDLAQFMDQSIKQIVKEALSLKKGNLRQFIYLNCFNLSCRIATKKRSIYEKKGVHIPPFLIASIAKECNLHCSGCYSIVNNACNSVSTQLSANKWGDIFREAQNLGISFVLLAGGEPLMRKDVIIKASENKKVLFPIFTNGTLIDDSWVNIFDKHRNLVPILSIEGDKETTDERRGTGVYHQLLAVMGKLKSNKILYGVSITVTKQNLKYISDEPFMELLIENGCSVAFYVEYVDADKKSYDIVPTEEDREYLREKLENARKRKAIMTISFPGDEKSMGGCLAAGRGFFHINSNGSAEPCPFSPYSDMSLNNSTLLETLDSPLFKKLQSSEILESYHNGGCVLFENADLVEKMTNG